MPRGNMPKPLRNLGDVAEIGDFYRAHIQFSEGGKKDQICGPKRNDRSQAEKDLEDMRACAALFL